MTCDQILALLLDAEPDDLLRKTTSPLALHLAQCASCRAAATRLHHGFAEAQGAYLQIEPASGEESMVAAPPLAKPHQARLPGSARPWLLVAVGIAALLAVVLLPRLASLGPAEVATVEPVTRAPIAPPTVQVPPEQNAIVLPTRDPLISVVWIY